MEMWGGRPACARSLTSPFSPPRPFGSKPHVPRRRRRPGGPPADHCLWPRHRGPAPDPPRRRPGLPPEAVLCRLPAAAAPDGGRPRVRVGAPGPAARPRRAVPVVGCQREKGEGEKGRRGERGDTPGTQRQGGGRGALARNNSKNQQRRRGRHVHARTPAGPPLHRPPDPL